MAVALYTGLRGKAPGRRVLFFFPLAWMAGGFAGLMVTDTPIFPLPMLSFLLLGALIAADAISFTLAMAWAVCGAVSGDGLSYWLGRHYHSQLRDLWPFRRYPQSLDQGIAFFEKYGGNRTKLSVVTRPRDL